MSRIRPSGYVDAPITVGIWLPPPTDDDVAAVCARAARRIRRLIDGDDDAGPDDHATAAMLLEAARAPLAPSRAALVPTGPPPHRRRTEVRARRAALSAQQAHGEQGVPLDRGLMSRYVEHAGNTLGATIVAAMWRDAIANGGVISTDATGALIQPTKAKDGRSLGCKKGHFFTAVVDLRAVLFAYAEQHTSATVQAMFAGFGGYLQADASAVYDVLDRGPPADTDDGTACSARPWP